jgi:hypothetical protein
MLTDEEAAKAVAVAKAIDARDAALVRSICSNI